MGRGRTFTPIITGHAVQRYRERVADIPLSRIAEALDCPAIRSAISFGAPYVRLPGGQRVALDGARVVTILPAGTPAGYIARRGRA